MRKLLLILIIGSVVSCKKKESSQKNESENIIITIAGNSISGFSGNGGAATNAQLFHPADIVVDGYGNIYIADSDNDCIRKIDPMGIISTIAGRGPNPDIPKGGNDVPATNAVTRTPLVVAMDKNGNIFIAEAYSAILRKIDVSGIITTIAGIYKEHGYREDGGHATAALLGRIAGITIDESDNIFISDYARNVIRKINPLGIINRFAGTVGERAYAGDGGPALAAKLNGPYGLAFDASGNLFVADQAGERIRMITPSGIISTYAGNGNSGYSGDNGPATAASLKSPQDIAFDKEGNMYIADAGNHRIRMINTAGIISTVAGTGTGGFNGDNKSATLAQLYYPSGVAVDNNSNIYIADNSNNRIRKVIRHR